MQKVKKHLTIHKVKYIVAGVLCLVIGATVSARNNNEADNQSNDPTSTLVTMVTGADFKKEDGVIETTGTVKSNTQVELKAELAGTVNKVNVELGQEVEEGTILLELDHKTLDAQVQQARASVNQAASNLYKLSSGNREEDVTQAKAGYDQAVAQLNKAKTDFEMQIKNAEIAAEQARINEFNTVTSNNVSGSNVYEQVQNSARIYLSQIENMLTEATRIQYAYFNCNDTYCNQIASAKETTIFNLYGINYGGRYNSQSVSTLSGGIADKITNSTITSYQADTIYNQFVTVGLNMQELIGSLQVASGSIAGREMSATDKQYLNQSTVTLSTLIKDIDNLTVSLVQQEASNSTSSNNAISQYQKSLNSLETLRETYESQISILEAQVAQSKAVYDVMVDGPRSVDLSPLRAQVGQAQAQLDLAIANRDKAYVKAPFKGHVYVLPAKIGELVSPGQRLVGVINESDKHLSTSIDPITRSKIHVGDKVIIDGTFNGYISHISPSIDPETNKVEVLINFDDAESTEILSVNQVVNIQIITATIDNPTYFIPLNSVKTTNTGVYLYSKDDSDSSKIVPIEIETGTISGEMIEVISGVNDDTQFILNVRNLTTESIISY